MKVSSSSMPGTHRRRTPFFRRAAAVLLLVSAVAALSASSDDDLILKNADSNENRLVNGELVSTLRGHVEFHYGEMKIFSDYARWWRDQGIIKLNDNIRVEQEDQTLTCDHMVFEKNNEELVASGNFKFVNTQDRLQLTGRSGRYTVDTKEFVLTGEPRFMRFDTTAAETLTIVGQTMTYNDSTQVATVINNVVITKGQLRATCNRAWYFTERERALLRGVPDIAFDIHTLTGDSVDLVFSGDTLKGVSVDGNAHGRYREVGATDTNLTDITSDSMFMLLSTEATLDSVRAFGNVESSYYLSNGSDTANEASGRRMILDFDPDGALEDATIFGNATSVYYVIENDGRGRNEASGDSIRVIFLDGRAKVLLLSGSVRGVYYPLLQ